MYIEYLKTRLYSLFISLFVLSLSGCSTTKLHLVSQGYSAQQVNQLKNELTNQGINVSISSITMPNEFPNSAIAMSPSYDDLTFIEKVQKVLRKQGFEEAVELKFAQGKHLYNINHLGLYLRNPLNNTHQMPPYLRTQYCKNADSTLMFTPNGKFVLEYDGATYEEPLQKVYGDYIFDGRTLRLVSLEHSNNNQHNIQSQQFTLRKESRSTPSGDKPADVFKPENKNHSLKQLNCDFLIIYMN